MSGDPSFTLAGSTASDVPEKLLWAVRLLNALALLSLILAQTLWKSSSMHDGCLGFGIGVLAVALVSSFQINRVKRRNAK